MNVHAEILDASLLLGQMVGAPLLGAIAMVSFPAMFLTAGVARAIAALAIRFADRPALIAGAV